MQTDQLRLASGMPSLAPNHNAAHRGLLKKGTKMSKIVSLPLAPSASLFSRIMATIDRLLMASARIAIRNGDLPYPGL
jgi:hypothetical protein